MCHCHNFCIFIKFCQFCIQPADSFVSNTCNACHKTLRCINHCHIYILAQLCYVAEAVRRNCICNIRSKILVVLQKIRIGGVVGFVGIFSLISAAERVFHVVVAGQRKNINARCFYLFKLKDKILVAELFAVEGDVTADKHCIRLCRYNLLHKGIAYFL